ncbi:MAG: hypothetical protein RMK80_03710 [Pseudobdellovibrionaceae bacterium]|nr:hypothetical protein [Pseudobdellovibrionaceae bacterium]
MVQRYDYLSIVSKVVIAIVKIFYIGTSISWGAMPWGRIHRTYINPRALGMGDAFTAISRDYSAVLYNPAALARRVDTEVNLSIDISASDAFYSFYKDLESASKLPSSQQFSSYYNVLTKNYGRSFLARLGLFHGAIAAPGWGLMVIPADVTYEMTVVNQAFPSIMSRFYGDTTVAFGIGRRIHMEDVEGKLDWGVTGKFVNRAYMNMDFTILDLVLNSNLFSSSFLTEGYTLDFELGFLYTPFLSDEGFGALLQLARPTFSLVVRNLLGGEFHNRWGLWTSTNNSGGQKPEPLYRVLDIGTVWEYPEFWIFGGRGALDIRNIGHPQFSFKKGLHLGFEFDWTVSSWWRGQYRVGINQGYLTYGMSALFTIFRLDLVSFGEEVGSENHPLENRTIMARFNMEF